MLTLLCGMHAAVYGRGQMVIPAQARREARIERGDVVSVEPDGDGRILLVRMEKPSREPIKVRIRYRKGTHAVATLDQAISHSAVELIKEEEG